MTLLVDAAANHVELVRQLYDDWHGWYQVVTLFMNCYIEGRVLSRREALAWRNPDPQHVALRIKHVRRM